MPKVILSPVADSIPFDDKNSTYKPAVSTVNDALVELRKTIVNEITTTIASATTLSLTIDNTTFHETTGGTVGFSYQLPSGITLSMGREYQIYNNSTETIKIKNGSGTELFSLNAQDYARVVLVSNLSVAGLWATLISSATATGIASYSIGDDTSFVTSNSSDILITGMTVTPVSGRYQCIYSADIIIGSNNKLSQIVFYKGGAEVSRSRRTAQGVGSNFITSHNMLSEITVNGSEAIDVRVNVSAGDVSVNQRRLILVRLGS